uniref:Interleukin-8 n=1 Tax=Oreochromis niloticus TaxID=8128 RepID=A0A669CCR0_ORENI
MISNRIIVSSIVVLLALLATCEHMFFLELHCRCIQTESKPIGRHIEKVELILPNSHCEETEIIATLKRTGEEVCLNPEAPWVKKVINKIMSSRS